LRPTPIRCLVLQRLPARPIRQVTWALVLPWPLFFLTAQMLHSNRFLRRPSVRREEASRTRTFNHICVSTLLFHSLAFSRVRPDAE
jgi:hypothetical protein